MSKYLKLQDAVLPLQHPRVLLETASAQGADPRRLLAGTGIEEAMLSDPDARISYASFGALTANALRLTGNPALGIDFGRRIRFTNLGMTGLAMVASESVEEAIRTYIKYGAVFAPAWDASLRVQDGRATITALSVLPFGELRAFGAEALLAAFMGLSLRDVPGQHELRLDYPPPAHAARYHELTTGPVRFQQPFIELSFDAEILQRPMPTADALTRALALRHCEADLQRLPARKRLVSAVRKLIVRGSGQYASQEAVASALGTNVRALRRALAELGTSYQMLLDERRREATLAYLRNASVALDQAAEELGFSDVRSLRRSVRRWTGMSLQELREQQRMLRPTAGPRATAGAERECPEGL